MAGLGATSTPKQNLYSFSLVKPGGAVLPLSEYKGKVVLLVTLASQSTFADQIAALQKLQDEFKDKGLVVLGVPTNDFGGGEPGDDAQIQKDYAARHVGFLVTGKSVVCGKDALPVFGFLTAAGAKGKAGDGAAQGPEKNEVHWSFTKFLVTREGEVGARFEPDVTPDSPEFRISLEKALAGTLKPGGAGKHAPGAGAGDDEGGDDDDGGL